jgi:hypothetical protein
MGDLHEQLSQQFYRWEQRGRGWQVFPEPVTPEPPFRPFNGYQQPPQTDDTSRPSAISSFLNRLGRGLSTESENPPEPPEPEEEPEPDILVRDSLVELKTSLPAKLDISKDAFEHFLFTLSHCQQPIAFELLGTEGRVVAQFAATEADAPLLRRQLGAHFPEATFIPTQDTLKNAWIESSGDEMFAIEFGLEKEFFFPLATGKLDAFVGIVGAMTELQPGEIALFQVLFEPVRHDWAENIEASVTHADGKPFFVNAPELTEAANKKASRSLFAAVVRIALCADSESRSLQLVRDLAGALRVFTHSQGNALIPLSNEDYPFEEHILDVVGRQSRRSGMLLTSDELIGFVHLPSSAVRSPVLQRDAGKTRSAPAIVQQQQGVLLGNNNHAGKTIPVRLTPDQLTQHVHIIGKQGTGKSTLLLNIIRQLIESGSGVAVLDPHGDLIQKILGLIPTERIDDVVLVDPADADYSVGFNILSAHSQLEKNLLASDLVSMFQRLSTSWGDQMDSVFRNAVIAFLESDRPGTLHDLRRFLIEPPFRAEFLTSVRDPNIIYYWQKVFPQLGSNKSIGPIATRLNEFLMPKPISHMLAQPENRLDFGSIMDTGKIFLAKLSKGLVGDKDSHLLGTLIVSKFQQLAMARQAQAVSARRDFTLVIDEFADFITPTMSQILTGARKYRLGLVLGHQELRQLQRNEEVASAVLNSPFTRISFRIGDDDARKLSDGFPHFEARDLQNLGKGEAIMRVERSDYDFNIAIPLLDEPDEAEAATRRETVTAVSRAKYARSRTEIEAVLRQMIAGEPAIEKPAPKPKPAEPKVESPAPAVAPKVEASVPIITPKVEAVVVAPAKDEVATPPPPAPVIVVPEPKPVTVSERKTGAADLGKGGAQHKAIQQRIKQAAEALGFHSTVEKQIEGSKQSVDLLLVRSDQSIACEISYSTTIDHEVGNVSKCLKAGFTKVAVICLDVARLEGIAAAVKGSLGPEAAQQVAYFLPDQFIADLQRITPPAPPPAPEPTTTTVHGYKVKRTWPNLTPEERQQRDEIANQVAREALRRKQR